MRHSTLLLCLSAAAITVSVFIFTAGCHKSTTTTEDISYASDQATSEQAFNDVQTAADQASVTTGSFNTSTTGGPCATVKHTGDSIIIDFGNTDCVCHDGRKRRGQIIIIYTGGNYTTVGAVHTITFNNFYQNDNKITGTKTVTNMGNNPSGQPYYKIHIEGSVALNGGGDISTVSDRVRTWTEGYGTAETADDVYEITGSGTLTRPKGAQITINITTPLIAALNCNWIEAGTVTYSFSGGTRTLNYGNATSCDNQATLTLVNGTVRNITLP